jgi:hypothetical protein
VSVTEAELSGSYDRENIRAGLSVTKREEGKEECQAGVRGRSCVSYGNKFSLTECDQGSEP